MTKTAESLTAQLRDIAWAFCLEVWDQALIAVGVSTKSELRAPDRVYYLFALNLAPSSSQPTSSSAQLASTLSAAPVKDKEKEQPPPTKMVDVKTEEAAEVA